MVITILMPYYNEVDNVEKLYLAIKNIFLNNHPDLKYNHLFIDNCTNEVLYQSYKEFGKKMIIMLN